MSNSFTSFSPYQTPPDESRSKTPNSDAKSKAKSKSQPTTSTSKPNPFSFSSYQSGTSSAESSSRFPASASAGGLGPAALEEGQGFVGTTGPGQVRVNKYETGLGIRVDVEAALAYGLGPVTGVALLIMEQKNDYVRFHAWQSALLFLGFMILQIIFSFSTILSWILVIVDIAAAGWLAYNAYMDGASLERYEVPIIGAIASQWVDSE